MTDGEYYSHQMRVSLNRQQVEQALAEDNTTLAEVITSGLNEGKSMEEVWLDLRNRTDIPFSVRTLYRWADRLEVAS